VLEFAKFVDATSVEATSVEAFEPQQADLIANHVIATGTRPSVVKTQFNPDARRALVPTLNVRS
jgi:hypothetical protein